MTDPYALERHTRALEKNTKEMKRWRIAQQNKTTNESSVEPKGDENNSQQNQEQNQEVNQEQSQEEIKDGGVMETPASGETPEEVVKNDPPVTAEKKTKPSMFKRTKQ